MSIFTKVIDYVKEKSGGSLIYQSRELSSGREKYGSSDYLNAREISLYLNKALHKRAQKVSEVEFTLKINGKDASPDDELLKLLAKPNQFQTGEEFLYSLQQQKDIFGNVFILLSNNAPVRMTPTGPNNKVDSLILLRPDWVEVKYNSDGGVEKYVYRQPKSNDIPYTPDRIIHIKRPSPTNPLMGESLLIAGMRTILTEDELAEYQLKIVKNGGQVGSVFIFKDRNKLKKSDLRELKMQYKKEYSEARRAGMPLFLAGDSDYKRLVMSPEELAFLESKKMTLRDICIMTEVPESLLASITDIKYDNAEQAFRGFMRDTVKPEMKQNVSALNEKRELSPENQELGFIDPTPEDLEAILKTNESGIKNYYLTPNEAREAVGKDPIDGGDELLVPFNVSPLGKTPDKPTQNKSAFIHPLSDDYFRQKYYEIYIKKADKRENAFVSLLNKYFDGQEKRLTEKLGAAKSFRKKSLIDDSFDKNLEIRIGFEMMLPILEKYLEESGSDAMKLMGSDYDFFMTADIKSWLEQKTNVFLGQINETTFEKLKSEFDESLSAAETRNELIGRIHATYGDISKSRAATIARTEIQGVTQRGTFEGYKQSGAPIKIWVSVRDGRTRESHASLDGTEVPINQIFPNGLMFPGDPNGSADETVNCRCSI